MLDIFEKEKGRFYIRCFKRNQDILVYDQNKNIRKPEEIIRQLWIYKLIKEYKYPLERIEVEKSVHFGREVHAKKADIVIYKEDKITPYIIFEVKEPKVKKAEEQLKSYLSAEGAEAGVWSNGKERFILYRQYPKEYITTLSDIPRADQTWDDLFEEKKTYNELNPDFDLLYIVKRLEELVLAQAGVNVFQEVFKLIYAKLYDEDQAKNVRPGKEVLFRVYKDPKKTYQIINYELFQRAIGKWPDVFNPLEKIELTPDQLQVCVPLLENAKFFESGREELDIIDSAFEYLVTEVSKGKKGQYFTPRNVIKICVKMLNPKPNEYIIDPACGSGGFLIHTMYWVWDNYLKETTIEAKREYAGRYLFGIDFDDNMRKTSQALMLIAGDGKHHIFKRNSLDARDWTREEAKEAQVEIEKAGLLVKFENPIEDEENRKTFRYLNFDVLMTNPPFAGEITDSGLLRQYEFAKKNGKLRRKMERHLLFLERCLDAIKLGGRMAIVLPQGVLNNTNLEWVRQWLLDKARILAVVGLHVNTFKPHTGTKTSVLFLQKWNDDPKLGPLCPYQEDYPIFMAVSKKPGKDNSGEYVYKKDEKGNYILDEKGRKILDHDLDEIAKAFIKFAKEQGFSFWK
ncbi:MAG: restriction endonuclease subunit M [Candidatus Parcubacteria bacterium]|nr:MAG: restriction endonuclease subunit M [Candidatus Parcubacteria bacterium]